MKDIRDRMNLTCKPELVATPGQVLPQFGPLPGAADLPFHIHLPAKAAPQLVVGNSYTFAIQETK